MIDFTAGFILPLMDHLVKKRVPRFFPAVMTNVPPADHDFRLTAFLTPPRIVTKAAFQPARNADGNSTQLPAELFLIELRVALDQLLYVVLIRRMGTFGRASRTRLSASVGWNAIRQQLATRIYSFSSRPGLDEVDNCTKDFFWRFEESTMNANFGRGEADDHGSVLCEPNGIVTVEADSDERSS